jgi:hypothetical protein
MPEPAARRWPAPVKGKAAEVSAQLWRDYLDWKNAEDQAAERARAFETQIREQIGDAAVITVDGVKVAVRVVQPVENASWVKDFLRRVPGPAS